MNDISHEYAEISKKHLHYVFPGHFALKHEDILSLAVFFCILLL
jgi:hypothetical protein